MKTSHYLKNSLKVAFVASALFLASCAEDNTALDTPIDDIPDDTTEINQVIVNGTNAATTEREIEIDAVFGTTVEVIVSFTKEEDGQEMDRLYIAQTLSTSTEGSTAYDIDPDDILDLDTKADGSLDLDGDREDAFNFTIDFPAPSIDDATVQYVIWATHKRGDYRDISDDNSFEDNAYAVITITAGTEAELSAYTEFTATILETPLGDASSKTFISAFNGQKYAINEGEETAALWDFGYFYDNTFGASFYSTSTFPGAGFTESIETVTGLSRNELNKCYFGKSSLTAAEFDAVSTNGELDNNLTTDSDQDTSGFVAANALEEGDIIEFLDQYGNKGLIKVTNIVAGAGSLGEITFDVKVQTNTLPINL